MHALQERGVVEGGAIEGDWRVRRRLAEMRDQRRTQVAFACHRHCRGRGFVVEAGPPQADSGQTEGAVGGSVVEAWAAPQTAENDGPS